MSYQPTGSEQFKIDTQEALMRLNQSVSQLLEKQQNQTKLTS
jgi:hypothetical protein